MIGALVTRELTIALRRGSIHFFIVAQTLLALALVAWGERLAHQATPWTAPALGSTAPPSPAGVPGAITSSLGPAIFIGGTVWLLLICLVVGPAVTGPALVRERERGTLGVLLGTGATPLAVVVAKLLGTLAQIGIILMAGLPALGLVFVFGTIGPRLLLGSAVLLAVWATSVAAVSIGCSALARTSGGAVVAAFTATLALFAGTLAAPALALQLGAKVPAVVYRLNPAVTALALQPDLGQQVITLLPIGSLMPAAALTARSFGLPWLPFAAGGIVLTGALVLLASYALRVMDRVQ
ncbi:MAG: hypothetical protein HYY04_12455 [Chloroflexi bacterium]|nr:hypothetical protein [Chloroflexota bacterium]